MPGISEAEGRLRRLLPPAPLPRRGVWGEGNVEQVAMHEHRIPRRDAKIGLAHANPIFVAPSDIISNLFLEDLERIWELKKWIPDPCNPYLHYLKPDDTEEI